MKTGRNILFGFLTLGLLGLNIVRTNSLGSTNDNLGNIAALQASAGEAWCDTSTQNPCTITAKDGTKVSGVGQPHVIW